MNLGQMWRVLMTPSCWIQVNPYSAVWDRKLKEALRQHKFRAAFYLDDEPKYAAFANRKDEYSVWLGPYRLWLANHPYASFGLSFKGPRPSRITILEAYDRMLEDLL